LVNGNSWGGGLHPTLQTEKKQVQDGGQTRWGGQERGWNFEAPSKGKHIKKGPPEGWRGRGSQTKKVMNGGFNDQKEEKGGKTTGGQ